MMTIQDLLQQKSGIVAEMRSVISQSESEKRDLTESESQRFSQLKGELSLLEGQIDRAETLANAERSMQTSHGKIHSEDEQFSDMCRSFSVTRAIGSHLAPGEVDAGKELEVSQELARRSGANPSGILVPHEVFLEQRDVTTAGSGGNLVGETHRPDLMIDRLRSSLQVAQLGSTVLDGLVGNQDIPRLAGSATGYWVAEHGAVTESDHTFDNVQLQPKTVGAEVEYSRRMLINAAPSVERLVRSDLARVLATAIDRAAIAGSGSGNQPEGILNTTGIGDVELGANGGSPTWSNILDVISRVATGDALMGSLGWLTEPSTVRKLRSTVRVDSTDSRFIMDQPDELAGYALRQSTNVPADLSKGSGTDLSALIFGNWSDLLIGYWSAVDILVNPYHSDVYSKGGVKINALQDCDIAVRHAESFAAIQDLDAAVA